jgi:Ca-activated chloride channel homolog
MNAMMQRLLMLTMAATLTACVAQDSTVAKPDITATPSETQSLDKAGNEPQIIEESVVRQEADRRDQPISIVMAESALAIPAPEVRASSPAATGQTNGMVAAAKQSMNDARCCFAPIYPQAANTERYQHLADNPVHLVAEQPVSTFSIDVDTGAYANVRRYLNAGQLPPQDAARVEEMINYFDYQYAAPTNRNTPFNVATEVAPAPWNANALLLKVGIKGYELPANERPAANLVFLIDVSGSMETADKLPLLKRAFGLLTDQLTAKDRVSMVVYAGNAGMVLAPTPGDHKYQIRDAIAHLEAGGSTNGADGIKQAYQLAHDTFINNGINRVVLATDGDFNVGVTNFEMLLDMAERERQSGIALTTLGFGTGNYNDELMERLADAGNGNYAYIDTLAEARKVLVSELSSTLVTIAKDVKIQVEFNPAMVKEYRLIGYENRLLAREDFNNDKVDAGEIGAGHRVTALYEIISVNAAGRVDPLRYATADVSKTSSNELAYVRLRYKRPDADTSQLLSYPIHKATTASMSTDLAFAASVAAFGQRLRGAKYLGDFGYSNIAQLAKQGMGEDKDGYRHEFLSLVKLAQSLDPAATNSSQRLTRLEE